MPRTPTELPQASARPVRRRRVAAGGLLVALLGAPAFARPALRSQWAGHAIRIDGRADDWQGPTIAFEKQQVELGVRNDGTYLYLLLTTSDRDLRAQILLRGLTIWLDPGGGKKRVFGVRHPLGLAAVEEAPEAAPAGGAEAMLEHIEASVAGLEISSPGEAVPRRLGLDGLSGTDVVVHWDGERLVYELRLPLATGPAHPFAPGIAPGNEIGLGLLTPPFAAAANRPRGQAGGPTLGTGAVGRPDGPSGPRPPPRAPASGGPSLGAGDRPDPLKLWTRVRLATGGE